MPSTRRTFLATLGSFSSASVVGCLGSSPEPLTVTEVEIRQSFEWLQASTHWKGVTLTDRQLVFVDIPEDVGVNSPGDVSLVAGDQTIDPSEEIAGVDATAIEWHSESEGVEPVFTLPLDVDGDTIEVRASGGGSYELTAETVGRIQEPPRLAVTGFESVGMEDGDLQVEITIENQGGHDAVVRGNLGSTALSGLERVDLQAPAGDSLVLRRSVNRFREEGTETIRFDWGVGSREVEVGSAE